MARRGGWYGTAAISVEIMKGDMVLWLTMAMVSWHHVTHLAYRLPVAEGSPR
jgi:hypothetical protein